VTAAPGAATTQPLPSQKRLRLAIVGGGPLCVYALERLVAHLSVVADAPGSGLRIEIFERSGRFGAGEVNSDRQPLTSLLNRVAAQIGFSADESNRRLSALLPQPARPTFHEWAQRRFRDTGDPTYALGPMSIPPRRLHGEALAEAFAGHAAALAGFGVEVRTHAAEVVDLAPSPEDAVALRATCEGIDIGPVDVDRVLLATGNAASFARRPSSRIADDGGPRRIAQAYPLQRQLDLRTVPADTAVAIRGLGLTAVDVFLHLTEGRGGRFETVSRIDPALRYVACGGEPQRIVAFSPSGMLPCCRAQNFKLLDPALAYRGVFFTLDAVARLRDVRGVPMRLHDGDTVRQLDFEADALPLVVLELARAYYLTLLGFEFDARAVAETSPVYQAFLDADASVALRGEAAIDALLAPLQMAFESACRVLGAPAGDVVAADAVYAVHRDAMRTAFDAVLFAPALPGRSRPDDLPATRPGKSPWGHPLSLPEHRFDWRRLFHPLRDPPMTGVGEPSLPEDAWRSRLIAFVRQDLRNARQGNLRNPIKAACDGVLRDLRSVFGALVDHGGLHAASHAAFLDGFMRTYHRLSNGAGIEAIEKTLALIDAGLVDLDVGPGASVAVDAEGFVLSGPRTGATRRAMVLIEGRLSAFDAADPVDPLYTNLLRRGLVRRWVNPGRAPDPDFVPGGLDLSPRFHPYDAAGDEDTRLTAMGTPAEGQRLLQSAAARPCCDSDVFNRLDVWASDILAALPSSRFPGT
jgi:hypothetical protein